MDLAGAGARSRAALEAEREAARLAAERIDVTLPPRTPRRGRLHPVVETLERVVDVLAGLGYRVRTGPEVESAWCNFDALRYDADHPVRWSTDSLYVDVPGGGGGGAALLRTHMSGALVRAMLAQPPPTFVAVPGRVYRADTADARHAPAFHQVVGLAVDRALSLADLRGTLGELVRALLGDVPMRLQPHHFPYTEPGAELDVHLDGRWRELAGCGMVHPDVLRAGGYDPEEVQGFVFGLGVERLALHLHGIGDVRLLAGNDLRLVAAAD